MNNIGAGATLTLAIPLSLLIVVLVWLGWVVRRGRGSLR
jgi:hypothetical protein